MGKNYRDYLGNQCSKDQKSEWGCGIIKHLKKSNVLVLQSVKVSSIFKGICVRSFKMNLR